MQRVLGVGTHVTLYGKAAKAGWTWQGPQRGTWSLTAFPEKLTLGPHVNVNHTYKARSSRLTNLASKSMQG